MNISLFLGDLHVPYYDEDALELVYNVIETVKPGAIYLLGDVMDFYQLSRFDKDPIRQLELQDDLDLLSLVLTELRKKAGGCCNIYMCKGNHEDRVDKWVAKHPEVYGLNCLKLDKLMRLNDYNIKLIQDIKVGDHIITHGDVVRTGAGNSARAMIDKYGMSGISGHTHRLGIVNKRQYSGNKEWIEAGCLCSLKPEYMNNPDWQQGFVLGYEVEDTLFTQLCPIIEELGEYKTLINGKTITN